MKTKTKTRSLWLAAALAGAGVATGGCSNSDATEDTTSAVSQAIEETSDATDAADVAGLLRGLEALRPQGIEGFHCDRTPEVTTVDVCGQALPATVHLEWTGCAGAMGAGGGGMMGPGGGMMGPGGGGMMGPGSGGGMMGPGGGGMMGPGMMADGGTPPAGATGCRTPGSGPSDGVVDIAYTYTAAADCTGGITREQAVTLDIKRTAEDGTVATLKGTTSATAVLLAGSPPQHKATKADVTRTTTDAAGTVTKQVRLVGEMSTAFSAEVPPTRTINGSYTETFLDGTSGTVTLVDVVRPPRNVCRWPTGGTLTRALAGGTTHVLAFGPTCGAATLDGTAVTLPTRQGHGGDGSHHGRGGGMHGGRR